MADRPQWGDENLPDPRQILDNFLKNKKLIIWLVVLGLVAFLGYNSFYQVEVEEQAIVLRLGEPISEGGETKVYDSGLKFKLPFIDQEYKIPVDRQLRLEFGFRSEPGKVTTVRSRGYEAESLMLTGDLLLAHVQWSVIYKIDDIETWLFKVKNQEDTIRDIAMAVMRQVVGDYSLHEVLTTKVREIQQLAMDQTELALKEKVPTGVSITQVAIKTTDPPERAQEAFDEFNRTEQKVRAQLSQAKAAKADAIGDAEGQQKNAIGQAQRQRAEIVNNAQGEAEAFLAQLAEYRRAPEITRQWLYLQTVQQVLGAVEEKLIIDDTAMEAGLAKLFGLVGDLDLPKTTTRGTSR